MCVDGEWVALAYILVHANVFHGILITAGDEKWARFSPGLLMVTGLMEWSAAQGHLYHDMSVGNLPYKADLGAEQRMLYEINEALSPVGSAAVFVRARMLRAAAVDERTTETFQNFTIPPATVAPCVLRVWPGGVP